nr:RNA-directed DNA polymerase, eukaryota [Tanacetum cinerariifolium]
MHEGVWLSDPKDIIEAFLNFYKKKFSCHDSQVSFPSFMPAHCLNASDQDLLEAVVSMEEIKTAEFVVGFFSSGKFPQGVNSAFITLIPKVSNPLFIKDDTPISLIGLHYKIVAKILSNRLSKVIDSIISPEQSAIISGRQILDGPLILSEIID